MPTPLIIVLIILGAIAVIAGIACLYIFVIRRSAYRHQINELEKKYSYLDALLLGQDSQYIHRLEVYSRTNLLYVEVYSEFSRRFKSVYDVDDKYCESQIKQAKTKLVNKEFKNIKDVINEIKLSIISFEEKVNKLDQDLYKVIKPEEDSRHLILKLKESYREVKQTFFNQSNDLEFVAPSFQRAFEKLDQTFDEFEKHIDSAEYEEANALIPTIDAVIGALKKSLESLPNLCVTVTKIIPNHIEVVTTQHDTLEQSGFPLAHLNFKKEYETWNNRLLSLRKELLSLQVSGIQSVCDSIETDINNFSSLLDKEVEDRAFFTDNNALIYKRANEVENSFLKVCSLLPKVEEIYKVDDLQKEKVSDLKNQINLVGSSKRTLDAFVHSGTAQPYSVLKEKLLALEECVEKSEVEVNAFKTYVESLKTNTEEAYNLVFAYYYRLRECEDKINSLNIESFKNTYIEAIEECYETLNEIDKVIKIRPIDVETINQRVSELKDMSSILFEEIDNKTREAQLAESAIVYANRDRIQQAKVNQSLSLLEEQFFMGEFETVYHDASKLYQSTHVDE